MGDTRLVMTDQSTLNKIRSYGSLGFSPSRIADMLALSGEERVRMISVITTEGTDLNQYYNQGLVLGDYNKDVELTKKAEKGDIEAITLLAERKFIRERDDLKRDLFGV